MKGKVVDVNKKRKKEKRIDAESIEPNHSHPEDSSARLGHRNLSSDDPFLRDVQVQPFRQLNL